MPKNVFEMFVLFQLMKFPFQVRRQDIKYPFKERAPDPVSKKKNRTEKKGRIPGSSLGTVTLFCRLYILVVEKVNHLSLKSCLPVNSFMPLH